jgi:hypothetical protein
MEIMLDRNLCGHGRSEKIRLRKSDLDHLEEHLGRGRSLLLVEIADVWTYEIVCTEFAGADSICERYELLPSRRSLRNTTKRVATHVDTGCATASQHHRHSRPGLVEYP